MDDQLRPDFRLRSNGLVLQPMTRHHEGRASVDRDALGNEDTNVAECDCQVELASKALRSTATEIQQQVT